MNENITGNRVISDKEEVAACLRGDPEFLVNGRPVLVVKGRGCPETVKQMYAAFAANTPDIGDKFYMHNSGLIEKHWRGGWTRVSGVALEKYLTRWFTLGQAFSFGIVILDGMPDKFLCPLLLQGRWLTAEIASQFEWIEK